MAEKGKNGGSENKAVTFMKLKPQLFLSSPNEAVNFYKTAFGAEEVNCVNHPTMKDEQDLPLILSVELKLGSTTFLVSLITEDSPVPNASEYNFFLETEDVKAAVVNAMIAGAVSDGKITEAEDARSSWVVGKLEDPYGNSWLICSPKKMKIMLKSSDGQIFVVKYAVAVKMVTIKHLITVDYYDQAPIPVKPNKESLAKIIEYCQFHVKAASEMASEVDIRRFDNKFFDANKDVLYDLIEAADFLAIGSFLNTAYQIVADAIKGKSLQEVRERFLIKHDFTPEREEEARRMFGWALLKDE